MSSYTRFAGTGLVLLATFTAGATLLAQSVNLRTGSWQYHMTVEGAIPMDGIPENMRASLEAEMRKPRDFTSCLTAEDLKNMSLGKTDDADEEDCTVTASRLTATGGDLTRECTGARPRTETMHIEATSPQVMRATIVTTRGQGTSTTTLTGKWLAAQCRE